MKKTLTVSDGHEVTAYEEVSAEPSTAPPSHHDAAPPTATDDRFRGVPYEAGMDLYEGEQEVRITPRQLQELTGLGQQDLEESAQKAGFPVDVARQPMPKSLAGELIKFSWVEDPEIAVAMAVRLDAWSRQQPPPSSADENHRSGSLDDLTMTEATPKARWSDCLKETLRATPQAAIAYGGDAARGTKRLSARGVALASDLYRRAAPVLGEKYDALSKQLASQSPQSPPTRRTSRSRSKNAGMRKGLGARAPKIKIVNRK